MIGLEIELALATWLRFVGDPDSGEISYRHGAERMPVPVMLGADDRERPVPCIVCDSLAQQWAQDYPAPNFRGIPQIEFRYPADPVDQETGPASEALRLARIIDTAIHRPEFTAELSEASQGHLYVSGFTAGIEHLVQTDGREWLHIWMLPLYVCEMTLQPSQDQESICLIP